MKKKVLSLLLALALVMSLLPIAALAYEPVAGAAPEFAAFVGETELSVVLAEEEGYTPYEYDYATDSMVPAAPVTLFILPIPDGTDTVDLVFTENVLAYNYTPDGKDYIAGYYEDYMTGDSVATVPVDGDGDGEPDCIQVQTPYDENWYTETLYAITFVYPPTFSASVGTTALDTIIVAKDGYTPYFYAPPTYEMMPCNPVPLYFVAIPEGTEKVDLKFSDSVLAYNYSADGTTPLDGWYPGDTYLVGDDTATVFVDADENGELDCIQVQTPYLDGVNSLTLFAITFYDAPFSAFVGDEQMAEIKRTEEGYTPYAYDYATDSMVPAEPVTLFTVSVPDGTRAVTLEFPENVLAYNYSPDGKTWLAGEYEDAQKGAATAAVAVDANKDGVIDFIQVQSPYDEYWNSDVLYAVTFSGASPSGGGGGGGGAVSEAALLSGIASAYAENGPGTDGNAAWATADMMAYATLSSAQFQLSAAQMDAVKDSAIVTLSEAPSASDAAKNIIALVAMGYDPTQLTAVDGTKFSGKDVLDALAFTKSGEAYNGAYYEYTLPYVIMAYRLLGDAESLQKLVALALEIKDAWMDTTWGVDGMTPFMVALAPDYGENSDVKAALDAAVKAVKAAQQANGSITGSAASTGLAIAGLTALGYDPHEIKNGEKSLIDGLLSFAGKDGASLGSAFDTEQGFRGLIASAKGTGYTTYAFDTTALKPAAVLSVPYVTFNIQPSTADATLVFTDPDGEEVAPVSAGTFIRLAEGEYSYTVSADGYETYSGTVSVSADSRETVYVSLVRSGSGDAPESTTAVVTVMVLSHDSNACHGSYTYLHNANAYYSILGDDESYAVTVVKGVDTARDALVATLTHYNIPFTEEANGYFSMINNEKEMSHGSPNSGWMYLVNGRSATVAAGQYVFSGNATMIWYFSDDYTNEYGSEDWNVDPLPSGGGASSTEKGETPAAVAPAAVSVAPEVVDGEAKAEIGTDDVTSAIEKSQNADALSISVTTTDADKVEASLSADAIKAIAGADMALTVETENGAVKVDAKTMEKLAETGKEVAVTVTRNADGSTTVVLTAGGENVDAKIKVALPAVSENQILVMANAASKDTKAEAAPTALAGRNGTVNLLALAGNAAETPVILSAVKDGVLRALIPAGATVKVVDAVPMTFADVKAADWFAKAVDFVTGRGIFQGTDQGFEPGADMNRAMLATVLYRIAGATGGGKSSFSDVAPGDWFADAVAWAADAGIVKGRDEGYAPAAPVTRQEIATMLYRFAQYLGVDVSGSAELSAFPDGGKTASWAEAAMAWAVSTGLFRGDQNGALNPDGLATRAEVATLTERLVELIVK